MAPFSNEKVVSGVKTREIEAEGKELLKMIKVIEGFPKPTWKPLLHGYKPMSKILEHPAGFMVFENMRVWRGLEEEDDDSDWVTDVESEEESKQQPMKYEEGSGNEDGYEASGESEETTSEEEEKVCNGTTEGEYDGRNDEERKPEAKAKKKSLQQKLQGMFKKNVVFPEAYSKKETTVELVVMEPIEEEESVEGSSDSMVDVPPACGSLCSLLSYK